jgi:alpha-amylase/alpha-mannosidase (GH57 family)
MTKSVCIHCHFYQPPRENPWLEAIEFQDSAVPFHDWNERISAECYNPNGTSRILDEQGWVVRLSNNYSRISFNFGPTLLAWMEQHDKSAYQAMLDGDRDSLKRFNGHGAAIAQGYNHIIMPLANKRDKITQVRWGLYDFERRFSRKAEAMWLPETAVDTETLEVLAAHGMKFVILAPRQAHAVRSLDDVSAGWRDVSDESIDPHYPYLISLPSGATIAAFFYDGPISRVVAFEGMLNNGEVFANRLLGAFDAKGKEPQIVHIATDGESYGHHHRHGDMALAYALDVIEKDKHAALTTYSAFLDANPPRFEVRLHENSSWSCVHGVERWRNDCGCNSGGKPGWNQKWRKPLRKSLDMLRDLYERPYEDFMAQYTDDPWGMRDGYIAVIADRSDDSRAAFFAQWLKKNVDYRDETLARKLLKALEVQRNLLLMYTSCGWFFDEVSGIETVQNLQYAARAIELAKDVFGIDGEPGFLEMLQAIPSNIPSLDNGRTVYDRHAKPARVDMHKIAAHLAVGALFSERIKDGSLYCYDYEWHATEKRQSGRSTLIAARLSIFSQVTRDRQDVEFCMIHMGDHNIVIGVRDSADANSFDDMVRDFTRVFGRGDLARSLRLLERYFGLQLYSLNDLFRDQQRQAVDFLYGQTLEAVESQFNAIYEQHYPAMCYLSDASATLPPVLSHIARFVQNNRIIQGLTRENISPDEIERTVAEARDWGIELDVPAINRAYYRALRRLFRLARVHPEDRREWDRLEALLEVQHVLPFPADIGPVQNSFLNWVAKNIPGEYADNAEVLASVRRMAGLLQVRLPQLDAVSAAA